MLSADTSTNVGIVEVLTLIFIWTLKRILTALTQLYVWGAAQHAQQLTEARQTHLLSLQR